MPVFDEDIVHDDKKAREMATKAAAFGEQARSSLLCSRLILYRLPRDCPSEHAEASWMQRSASINSQNRVTRAVAAF